MHRPFLRLTLLLTFALAAGTVRADLSFFGPAPPPPTLAQALAALEAPKQDLFLTVGADRITLPPGDPPPDPDSRPGQVGTAYGRLIRDFGGVMALAPPTMVVLNTRPGVPDPYDGLPVEDALQLLLAGLTPSQWTALTGPSGLGAADLSDDAQRGLFLALLPNGTVTVRPQVSAQFSGPVPAGPAPQPISVTVPTLRAARLHLNRWTSLISVAEGKPNQGVIGSFSPFEGKVRYETSALLDPFPPPQETAAGAVLRQVLPNNPKDADLDYDAAPLKRSVRLEGIATVGDLVARVGQSAGLELYADPRYAGRQVTLVGRRTARGVDLLRAAAFCVMGTFRRVGPAYVLTDDLQGTALRRARLGRFMGEAAMTRHAAVEAAGDSLMTAHGGLDALPPLDDRGMSSAQAALPKQEVGSAWGGVQVTFTQLTPAQQDYATALMRQANAAADQAEAAGGGRGPRWTPGGTFVLSAQPALFWQSPAVPGPFLLSAEGLNADSLYQISLTRRKEIDRLGIKDDPATCRPPPPPPVPPTPPSLLASLMAPLPRRAVLAAPRTAREVDRVVAQMKTLGLNQLWLDVFSGGHSRLDAPGRRRAGHPDRSAGADEGDGHRRHPDPGPAPLGCGRACRSPRPDRFGGNVRQGAGVGAALRDHCPGSDGGHLAPIRGNMGFPRRPRHRENAADPGAPPVRHARRHHAGPARHGPAGLLPLAASECRRLRRRSGLHSGFAPGAPAPRPRRPLGPGQGFRGHC